MVASRERNAEGRGGTSWLLGSERAPRLVRRPLGSRGPHPGRAVVAHLTPARGHLVVGIDERTAILGDGGQWTVHGFSGVTIRHGGGAEPGRDRRVLRHRLGKQVAAGHRDGLRRLAREHASVQRHRAVDRRDREVRGAAVFQVSASRAIPLCREPGSRCEPSSPRTRHRRPPARRTSSPAGRERRRDRPSPAPYRVGSAPCTLALPSPIASTRRPRL